MNLAAEYPISAICQVLDYPRSSFYYEPTPEGTEEQTLKAAVSQLAERWPTYGYRRITAQLQREGLPANSKRVRRIMHELGLASQPSKRRVRTTNSLHDFARYPNLVADLQVTYPEQVWVGDITYVRVRSEFVYLAVLMDVFTRSIRGWHLGHSLDGELTLTALRRALSRGAPQIHHSDQGVQYAASGYVELLKEAEVAISMAEVGQAWQNGYAERLMRTIKEEEVQLQDYEDYHDAYTQIGKFLDEVYQRKRIHSSLGYLTPAEFEAQWIKQQAEQDDASDTNFQT
jgi:transposase InsO family protein